MPVVWRVRLVQIIDNLSPLRRYLVGRSVWLLRVHTMFSVATLAWRVRLVCQWKFGVLHKGPYQRVYQAGLTANPLMPKT